MMPLRISDENSLRSEMRAKEMRNRTAKGYRKHPTGLHSPAAHWNPLGAPGFPCDFGIWNK